ncbi:MAG: tRNA-dihydrouridine synthase family protein [Oscillospiraceae bacterium]|nr:tRNA-dihydrouridine synthase family protein [Oscillospiraceae bacterium]
MKLYFAPLEGITTYTFRNTHFEMFGGADRYFAPFINPSDNEKVSKKGFRDILPENNGETPVTVQVLTANAESFLKFEDKLSHLPYDEININIGCPASTVVRKGRGSGFLKTPDAMDEFFSGIFSKTAMKVSVKTRIGYSSKEEFPRLMEIYNKYPLASLTVHPRTREQAYKGECDMDAFSFAYNETGNALCYNGDIRTAEDVEGIEKRFPNLSAVMLGRGAVANPAIFREIRGGEKLRTEELIAFSKLLAERYIKVLGSEVFTLHKLKEVWIYAIRNFPEETKLAKEIKKAATLSDFMSAISKLPNL